MKKEDSYQHRCQLFTLAKGQTCLVFLSLMKKEDLYQHKRQLFTLAKGQNMLGVLTNHASREV
jgi:hypothetical protein